jgi:hypothetical protein
MSASLNKRHKVDTLHTASVNMYLVSSSMVSKGDASVGDASMGDAYQEFYMKQVKIPLSGRAIGVASK